MRLFHCLLVAACLLLLALSRPAFAQTTPATSPSSQPKAAIDIRGLKEGWEDVDKRYQDLVLQLAACEEELVVVRKSLRLTGYKLSSQEAAAERADKGNELMDRNAGMPVDWRKFYGKTAEKFFYHPTDPNTTYHTQISLTQQSEDQDRATGTGVASRQGYPPHQRPPQWDFVYRANDNARERALKKASEIGKNKDALLAWRRELEAKQATLWLKIAFRGAVHSDITRKIVYRFELKVLGDDAVSQQRQQAIRAGAAYVRDACIRLMQIIDLESDTQVANACDLLRLSLTSAQKELDEKLLSQPLLVQDYEDTAKLTGLFYKAAERLSDASKSLTEFRRAATQHDNRGEEDARVKSRMLLQQAICDLADTVFTLDALLSGLREEWKVIPDTSIPMQIATTQLSQGTDRDSEPPSPPVQDKEDRGSWTNSLGMKFAYIPAGEFMMGSPDSEPGRDKDETQHKVRLSKPFLIQTTEVTQGQWKALMRNNPSRFQGDDSLPVECVSWTDAAAFCKKLSEKEGRNFRLPTEAEWEYACRATSSGGYSGTGRPDDMGWYETNAKGKTHTVGQKRANAWGLYDMHGNVWELCADWYGEYPVPAVTDPSGPVNGRFRVVRGGSWALDPPANCRSASRHHVSLDQRVDWAGIRCVLDP
jgi:formylglycine-generating enzyme required for sulfatase activity